MDPFIEVLVLIISIAVIIGILGILLVISRSSSLRIDEERAFEVVKLIEALREICPLGSRNGWTLVSSGFKTLRCWQQVLKFSLLGSNITIYGSSLFVNSSSVAVLNTAVDIKKWPEWKPVMLHTQLQVKSCDEVYLQRDSFMYCDQIVAVTDEKLPAVVMYRFGNLQSDGVVWGLLWHVRRLDWCFFLAQPVIKNIGNKTSQCLLTAIQGASPSVASDFDRAAQLVQALFSIKDEAELNSIQIRPFHSITSGPVPPSSPVTDCSVSSLSLNDSVDVPSELFRQTFHMGDRRQQWSHHQHVLTLVPFTRWGCANLHNLRGYILSYKQVKSSERTSHSQHECTPRRRRARPKLFQSEKLGTHRINSVSLKNVPSKFQRTDSSDLCSSTTISPNTQRKTYKNKNILSTYETTSQKQQNSERKIEVSLKTDDKNINDEQNFLPCKSFIPDQVSSTSSDENEHDSSEEFEILLPPSTFEGRKSGLKTMGNVCISQLQEEIFKVSSIPMNVLQDEVKQQDIWTYESSYKGIPLFSKQGAIGDLCTHSYLARAEVSVPPLVAWNFLCNPLTKFMYDETVKKVKILHEFSNGQKILHTYHEITGLLRKYTFDFCLLHTERQAGTQWFIGIQSLDSENCPLLEGTNRGMLLPSGWVVESVSGENSACTVTHLIQFVNNSDSILLSEMSTSTPQSLANLQSYLMTSPM